tara:strand:- start:272 stop:667 length:396 start_codon:yes stop_codon:yes gene_type:complete
LIELGDSDITSCFKTISDLKWMKTFIEELLGLLKDGTSQNDNTGSSISDFVILGGRELNEESGGLMMDFHLLEDGSSIIGNDNFTVWGNKHLIHTLWSKGCLKKTGNSFGSKNVDLWNDNCELLIEIVLTL